MLSGSFITKISPLVYRIGSLGVPIYLIDTPRPVIIDAGYSFSGDYYVNAIRSVLGERLPEFCLVTHTHFDHVGSLGVFKREFPSLTVFASSLAKDISEKEKAMLHIERLNHFASNLEGERLVHEDTPFIPFEIDGVLSEGDCIDLGKSIFIKAMETHGHTRDSLCYLLSYGDVLFTGDSGGILHESGYLFFDFLSGCSSYLKSLEKIRDTKARLICPGHYKSKDGVEAHAYMENLVPGCLRFIDLVADVIKTHKGKLSGIMKTIKSLEYDVLAEPKQPEPAYLLNLEARIKSVASFISVNLI